MIGRSLYFRENQVYGRVWLEDLHGKCSESCQVSLSLPIEVSNLLLEETLDLASRKSYSLKINNLGSGYASRNPSLITNLSSTGWCPSEVSLIMQEYNDT